MSTTVTLKHFGFVLLTSCVTLVAIASPAKAVTIASYPFTGPSFASTDPGTSWSTSDLTAGAGIPLTTNAGGVLAGTLGTPIPAAEVQYGDLENQTTSDVTLAETVALNNYYSFVVTPLSGYSISLDEFSLNLARTGAANVSASIFTSIDGFTVGDVIDTYTSAAAINTYEPVTFDLSTFTDIVAPFEVRLYLHRNAATTMTNTLFTDNLLLTATVMELPPAPEPSSLILICPAAIAVLRRVRKSRRS